MGGSDYHRHARLREPAEMSQDDEPQWHLLPHQPIAFFGLKEPFDRKELKRAYNSLVRKFKPDKAPQEFQKIRAAYELLDSNLRYGESNSTNTHAPTTFRWQPGDADISSDSRYDEQTSSSNDAEDRSSPSRHDNSSNVTDGKAGLDENSVVHPSAEDKTNADVNNIDAEANATTNSRTHPGETASDDSSSTAKTDESHDATTENIDSRLHALPKSLFRRLETESLPSIYDDLRGRPREPFDYFALALISDSLHAPGELEFLRWLLRGLHRFPDHPALLQLVIAYVNDAHIEDSQLSTVILELAQAIPNDRFYFIAEKLFDRYITRVPWDEFIDVVRQCERGMRDHNLRCAVVFTCHLLRRAIWLAPLAACEQLFTFLNENHQYLNNNLEYELELNSRLLSFVRHRETFRSRGKICAMMDDALRAWCMAPQGDGDREIVMTQAYIAQHPEELFREIKLAPEEDMAMFVPWIWISEEVEDRLETQLSPVEFDRILGATFQMMLQIDQHFPATALQIYSLLNRGLPVMILLVILFVVPPLTAQITEWFNKDIAELVFMLTFIASLFMAAGFWFQLQHKTFAIYSARYLQSTLTKNYRGWWRSLIGRFFAATHYRYREVDKAIDTLVAHQSDKLNVSTWLPHFYSRDIALFVYSTAVRFLR